MVNNKPRFDWSNLNKDYKKYKSIVKISEMYGCSPAAVHYRLKQKGIEVNSQRKEIPNIKELYIKHKSATKIANILNVSKTTVLKRLEELGIERNHDNKSILINVGLGRIGEKIALDILEGSKLSEKINSSYDLIWKGKKIDVKTAHPTIRWKNKNPTQWVFGTRKKRESDHYLCIGLSETNHIEKVFLIPVNIAPKGNLALSRDKTKYDEYLMEVNKDGLNEIIRNAESFTRKN